MSKETSQWHSERVGREVKLARWGDMGTPVLVFPTAAGDAEEIERFLMIDALGPLLEKCRIKVYSVDSVAGMVLLNEDSETRAASRAQNQFDSFIYNEVVPAIRTDCKTPDIEIITAGASIGAFNALAATCRHPDVFKLAICMSGTYDLLKFMEGEATREHYANTPTRFLRDMPENEQLNRLRSRFVLLTHGKGRWEDPENSWQVAQVLGLRGIPNRVVEWGNEWDHDWPTWRKMLPMYLDEYVK